MSYEYDAEVVRVIDGDTVRLRVTRDFDFGFYVKERKTYEGNFRLLGINAPELYGQVTDFGLKSKNRLIELLAGKAVKAITYKPDKYGRWLVELFVDGININQQLVTEGFAIASTY